MASDVLPVFSRLLRAPAASPEPPLPHQSTFLRSLFLRLPIRLDCVSSYPTSIPWHRRPRAALIASMAWSSVEDGFSTESVVDDDLPTSIKLVPVTSEQQFDRIVEETKHLEEPVIFLWMANWCRKCIYLKPKLEKLAADYHPRIRFYCVDVNTVPQRLVNRAEIKKMPTVQLWRDGEKQQEVIGGHQAWLVIDDVRRMIENED